MAGDRQAETASMTVPLLLLCYVMFIDLYILYMYKHRHRQTNLHPSLQLFLLLFSLLVYMGRVRISTVNVPADMAM